MSAPHTEAKIDNFRKLNAWQTSKEVAITTYGLTKRFPVVEKFNLTSQMRRSPISISSNIAEGFSRKTKKDKVQFYQIALGSNVELQSQLEISRDVGLVSATHYQRLSNQLIKSHKLVNGIIESATDWHVKHT